MLSTLASYLLGSQSSEQAAVAPEAEVRLRAVETDDDWLLVETAGAQRPSESGSGSGSGSPLSLSRVLRPGASLSRASSASSLPGEDSWFVTPPPCFTSAGPVHMETSPLEDLLIEHPSMSVYQRAAPAPAASRSPSPPPLPSPSADAPAGRRPRSRSRPRARPRSPASASASAPALPPPLPRRQNNALGLQHRQQQQLLHLRSGQKVQQRRACQTLKRNHLERQNKARENSSRKRVLRRSDYMQNHSGANNNRKC